VIRCRQHFRFESNWNKYPQREKVRKLLLLFEVNIHNNC
jgi:hypothetical protein